MRLFTLCILSFLLMAFFGCEKVNAKIEEFTNPTSDLPANKVLLVTRITIHGHGYFDYASTNKRSIDTCSSMTLYQITDTLDVRDKNYVYLNIYSLQDSLKIDYSIRAEKNTVYFEIESGRSVGKPSVIVQRNLDLKFLIN
jgi:hypothetical protein